MIDPDAWPEKEMAGYYEQESISEMLGYAVYVWIACEHIPGCLKPFDAVEFASQHESPEPRRFAVAYLDTDGKIQWGWYGRRKSDPFALHALVRARIQSSAAAHSSIPAQPTAFPGGATS